MPVYVLRVIVLVLSVPVLILGVRAVIHCPAKGHDDPVGTSRKSLLVAGAITALAMAFAVIGDIVAAVLGIAPGGAFGPLSFLVLDAAFLFLVYRLVWALGGMVDTSETRTVSLALFVLVCVYAVAEVTSGDLSSSPIVLIAFPLVAVGVWALASHTFLARTAGSVTRGISDARRDG